MIYADHAATTPLSPAAREAMEEFLAGQFGNPSTLYGLAREPRRAVKAARERIAEAIGAMPEEILFTSGGTKSDNMALKGTAFRFPGKCVRFVTSAIEHHAVLDSCAFLEHMGHAVTYVPVDGAGVVDAEPLERAIMPDTALVSVMLANNEIGTIEPIQALSNIAHERGALFHTDAVQAVGHIPVDVDALGVDMLSASAHKFGGPKGVGFLYIRTGTPIEPLLHGGGQERGLRSSTENVAGIAGMAAALNERLGSLERDAARLERLRSRLIHALDAAGLDFVVNGAWEHIPGSLSLSFRNASGEALLHRLDLMGIAVATGSACDSKDTVLSHVIRAIGVPPDYAHGTIRITLGPDNDEAQVDLIAAAITKILKH